MGSPVALRQRINMRMQLDYITMKVRDHLDDLCLNEWSVSYKM